MSVSVKVTPKVEASRLNELATGVSGGDITVTLPAQTTGGRTIAGGATTLTCTKLWAASIALSVSTPVTLDLSALTGGQGDTAFTAVKLIDVRNNEAVASGEQLLVGGAASNAFAVPFGDASDIVKVDPGCALTLYTRESAGWTVSTAVNLKLDPGANAISCTIVIAGD